MSDPERGLTLTWVVMLLLALGSAWLADHPVAGRATMTLVICAAAAKGSLVLIHFMDLRRASLTTQLALFGWVGTCVALIIVFN